MSLIGYAQADLKANTPTSGFYFPLPIFLPATSSLNTFH